MWINSYFASSSSLLISSACFSLLRSLTLKILTNKDCCMSRVEALKLLLAFIVKKTFLVPQNNERMGGSSISPLAVFLYTHTVLCCV